MPASVLFCQHVLQHSFVETEVGNQPLQPQVFLFQSAHMFQFRWGNSTVFLTPRVKNGIGDTQLAADAWHGRPLLHLLQGKDNLLFGES